MNEPNHKPKRNVFVIATEYQILVSMSIIFENFNDNTNENLLVLTNTRTADINPTGLPENTKFVRVTLDDKDLTNALKTKVFDRPIDNLFVVHTFRPFEAYLLHLRDRNTKVHLMQDGALFYHRMERPMFLARVRQTWWIYKHLFQRGILLKRIVFYKAHMHYSTHVSELWMTHPDLFIDPKTKKKKNVFKLIPDPPGVKMFNNLFLVKDEESFYNVDDCLIYLAPIIRDKEIMLREVEEIKILKSKLNKSRLIIKIHPLIKDQFRKSLLEENFGKVVVQNNVPAELYMANATNSCVVGSASTALFYRNNTLKSYALKHYYQRIGLYAPWKNVNLPAYVQLINDLSDFDKINEYEK